MSELCKKLIDHPFKDITFYDETHMYINSTGLKFRSVTGVIHKYTPPFDLEVNAKKYAEKEGIPVDAVKRDWEAKGEHGSNKGTLVHSVAEDRLTRKVMVTKKIMKSQKPDTVDAIQMVSLYVKRLLLEDRLVHLVSEFIVYDMLSGVSGMIDQIFWDRESDSLLILDWKTSKKIAKNNPFGGKMLHPFEDKDDCEFNTYSLQLSLYKHLIMKATGIPENKIKLQIGWIKETNDDVVIIDVPYLADEVKYIMDNEIEVFNNIKK